jgi:mono/diheme cytochrome c family protein
MALLLLVLATLPIQGEPPEDPLRAEARDLFATRCVACHLPPDPRFAVERAWLAQVADTA